MTDTDLSFSRRTALAGAAAGLSLAGLPRATAAAAPDFKDRSSFLTAVIQMRGAIDGSLAMGWIKGQRYAVIDGKSTPLFGILAATFFTYTRRDPLVFEMRSLEVAYYTDLATGALLETWENPFTGKTVTVPQTRMGPSVVPITPNGFDLSDNPRMRNLDATHRFRPAVVHQDDVWVTEEINIAGDPPASGPAPFRYNEMTTYNASLKDLSDPDRATVPTRIQYQSIVGFTPWAGMQGLNAMNMGRGSGRSAERIEDLPADYLALTETHHPDVLNNPLQALQEPRRDI